MATTGDQIKRPESSLPKKTWAQPGATAGLGRQTGAMARERLSLRTAERVVKLVFVPYLITSFVGGILILGLVLAAGHVMSADAPTYELTYEPSYEPTSAFYSFGMSGIGGAIIAFVIQAAAIYVASWFAMVGCAMVTKAAWGVAPRPFEMGVRAAYGAFVVVVFFIFASTAGMLLSLFVEFLISIGLAELGRTGILIGLGISLIGGLLIFVIASAGVVYSFVGFIKEVGAQAQLRQ